VGTVGYWGQTGRFDQLWISRGAPIAPSSIHALIARILAPSLAGKKVRGDLGFARGLDHDPRFLQTVGQRLVHEHVLALLHCGHSDRGVEMIGSHDFDCVQIL